MILSHHGKVEFGSPKEPMFPEALLLHFLDEIDSKLEAMRVQYATDEDRPGDWTARNPALRRELLKIERGLPDSSNSGAASKSAKLPGAE
jgi:3'-5' exoribonuclease